MRRVNSPQRSAGLTLIEALLAVAVLEVAVLAVTYALSAGRARADVADNVMTAIDLAEALTEEILARPYDDPDQPSRLGPEWGERNRTEFDNIDDFHDFTDAVADPDGGPGSFRRRVTMGEDTIRVSGLNRNVAGLTVTVSVDDGDVTRTLTRFVPEPGT